jgi:hypothetical protein
MTVPERITGNWLDTLADADLVLAESALRQAFFALERREKGILGPRYDLMRGPAELMAAWSNWSLVSNEAARRGIRVRRKPQTEE